MQIRKDSDLVVETTSGRAQGFLDRGVAQWRGVPYGRIDERFRPASPCISAEPILATNWGPVSWRVPTTNEAVAATLPADAVESEQCLNLNVWSAGSAHSGPRPVLVWLHAGWHMLGCGNARTIDPRTIAAQHDVVVVTGNYRLGPWGWLHLGLLDEDFGGSTNLAIRDQLLMLAWIRDNIARFGGDPDCVTLFGAAAGGADVGTLLGVPAARGLFHQAAVYSGTAEQPVERGEAVAFAERFLDAAGSLASGPADLMTLSNFELRYIHRKMQDRGTVQYRPVIDGDLLPRAPLESVREGLIADVSLLVSVTADEARFFDLLSEHHLDDLYDSFAGADPEAAHDVRVDAVSRRLFIEPAERLLAAANAGGGRSWAQVFDYHPTTSPIAKNPRARGKAVHTSDTAALFFDAGAQMGTQTDRAVAAAEQGALIGLATNGQPGWAPYTPAEPKAKWIGPSPAALRGLPLSSSTPTP
jgi:para-nitrobenzyl esterase